MHKLTKSITAQLQQHSKADKSGTDLETYLGTEHPRLGVRAPQMRKIITEFKSDKTQVAYQQ